MRHMQPERIDIAELLIRKAGKHVGTAYAAYWEAASPGMSTERERELRTRETEACIEAVLMFQGGMEAIINEEISTNRALVSVRKEREFFQKKVRDLSFKNKWEHSYSALGIEDDERYLQHYLEFYRVYRVPITHPENRYFDISLYRFPLVYEGIRNGWMAFMALSTTWEEGARQRTWSDFCAECNLPSSLASPRGDNPIPKVRQ
jgi:hypothetical protein